MNKRDSEIVRGLLEEQGYAFTDNEKDADVILFNTCSVREHAEHRVMSILGALSRKKKNRTKTILGLLGCVAQHKKKAIFKSLPYLDFICGPADIYKVPELILKASKKGYKIISVKSSRAARSIVNINPYYRDSQIHAYVNIMYGCNNFCSYCIVPYVRGEEVSRPLPDIIEEIKALVKRNITNITLLGQNVNSYHGPCGKDYCNFVELLKQVNNVDGIKKINFVTSHPKDATITLFEAMKELDKVDKHLHLPLQSGSNRILKLMNRGYIIEEYMKLVEKYQKIIPRGTISTDIIVGFPGETEEDFDDTRKAMKSIRFTGAYIFKYSPRPPAEAATLDDNVPVETKKMRNQILLDLQKRISKG